MPVDIVSAVQNSVVTAITSNIVPITGIAAVAFIAKNIGTILNYIKHHFIEPPPKIDGFEPPELSNEAWFYGTGALSEVSDDSAVCCSEKDMSLTDWDNGATVDRSELPELHDDLTVPEGGELIDIPRGGFVDQSPGVDFDDVKDFYDELNGDSFQFELDDLR